MNVESSLNLCSLNMKKAVATDLAPKLNDYVKRAIQNLGEDWEYEAFKYEKLVAVRSLDIPLVKAITGLSTQADRQVKPSHYTVAVLNVARQGEEPEDEYYPLHHLIYDHPKLKAKMLELEEIDERENWLASERAEEESEVESVDTERQEKDVDELYQLNTRYKPTAPKNGKAPAPQKDKRGMRRFVNSDLPWAQAFKLMKDAAPMIVSVKHCRGFNQEEAEVESFHISFNLMGERFVLSGDIKDGAVANFGITSSEGPVDYDLQTEKVITVHEVGFHLVRTFAATANVIAFL